MDKKQNPHRQKPNPHLKQTGARRLSDNSANFIQYPGNTVNKTKSRKLKNNRQQAKSRKDIRKQRNQNRFVTAVLVTILLAICLFISLKVLFIVRTVESTGSERYTQEEIVAFCAIPLEENIFKIETKAIAAALPENFTYIEKAKVSRRLPDKILVTVTDSIPTYYNEVKDGELSTYTIYSQGFKKLTVQAAAPMGLMGIDADLTNENNKKTLQSVIDLVHEKGYEGISCIAVQDTGEISIIYDDRVTVKLGTMLDMEYKLKMSFHILTEEIGRDEKGVIDSTTAGNRVFKPQF